MTAETILIGKTSIRKKFLRVIFVVSMVSVAVMLAGFLLYERITFRNLLAQDLMTKAKIISENINAAVAFHDSSDAAQVLASLASHPNVTFAAAYDQSGTLFATYNRQDLTPTFPAAPQTFGSEYTDDALLASQAVVLGDDHIGSLVVATDLTVQRERMWSFIGIATVLLAASLLVAYLVMSRLEKKISEPVMQLAAVARTVSEDHDYSIRAEKTTSDEIGTLVDAFNEMLENIQARNADLNTKNTELENAEKRYRSTLDNMLEGCQIVGYDWRYLYANDVAAKHGRRTKRELVGHTMMELYPGIEKTEIYGAIKRCLEKRIPFQMENEFTFPDGSTGWFDVSIEPVPEGAFILTSDISREKRLHKELEEYREHLEVLVRQRTEQLEATNKELEAFSYSVSHDLRAPLRHIDGFTELLQKKAAGALDDHAKRLLDTISRSAKHMGALIDDLLVFSRMGRTELRKNSVNSTALLKETIDNLSNDIGERKVEWKIHTLPSVEADRNMLSLVFQNLLGNAVKYTRPRERALVEIGCTSNEEEHIFYVRDNGVGFDMKYVDKLFGVFQRLHRSDEFEGTGIGLANVRRIVSRHGGKTWAEAVPDKGTTIFFTLPTASENGQTHEQNVSSS